MVPFWFYFTMYLIMFVGNAFFWHRKGWYDAVDHIHRKVKERENENYRG